MPNRVAFGDHAEFDVAEDAESCNVDIIANRTEHEFVLDFDTGGVATVFPEELGIVLRERGAAELDREEGLLSPGSDSADAERSGGDLGVVLALVYLGALGDSLVQKAKGLFAAKVVDGYGAGGMGGVSSVDEVLTGELLVSVRLGRELADRRRKAGESHLVASRAAKWRARGLLDSRDASNRLPTARTRAHCAFGGCSPCIRHCVGYLKREIFLPEV